MAALSPRSVHVTDQILAVLREAAEPLPTGEIEKRTGYGIRYGQLCYRMLARLERTGQAEKLTLPDMKSRYWRLAGGPGFTPTPARAHVLRAQPPWRPGRDVTLCGEAPAGLRVVSWDEMDEALRRPPPWGDLCPRCATARKTAWAHDPAAVIHADAHEPGARSALRAELRALASLAAEYPDRFASLLEAEQVMQALGGS